MTKHTPGPWTIGSYDFLDQQVYIDAPSGDPDLGYKSWEGVAIAYGCDESPSKGLEKAKANAMLIAAAPELLEALQALERSAPDVCCADFNHFKGDFHGADEACPPLDRWHAACLAARSAIAKAKGQQHD